MDASDVQFYKGRLYAVNCKNQLVALDYSCHNESSGSKDAKDPLEFEHRFIVGHDRYAGAAPMEYLIVQEPADWFGLVSS